MIIIKPPLKEDEEEKEDEEGRGKGRIPQYNIAVMLTNIAISMGKQSILDEVKLKSDRHGRLSVAKMPLYRALETAKSPEEIRDLSGVMKMKKGSETSDQEESPVDRILKNIMQRDADSSPREGDKKKEKEIGDVGKGFEPPKFELDGIIKTLQKYSGKSELILDVDRSDIDFVTDLSDEELEKRIIEWFNTPLEKRTLNSPEARLIKAIFVVKFLEFVRKYRTSKTKRFGRHGELVDYKKNDKRFRTNWKKTVVKAARAGGVMTERVVEMRREGSENDAVLVIDVSWSMSFGKRILLAAVAAMAILEELKDSSATMSLVVFSGSAVAPVVRTKSIDDVINAILMLSPSGSTSYAAGLKLAGEVMTPRSTVFVIGDFEDYEIPPRDEIRRKGGKIIGLLTTSEYVTLGPEFSKAVCDNVYYVRKMDEMGLSLALALEEL